MAQYKALRAGVLVNPYQFVTADEVIDRPEVIDADWLVPVEAYVPAPLLPITSAINSVNAAGNLAQRPSVPDVTQTEQFAQSIKDVIAQENAQDAIAKKASTGGEEQAGTGNQDVLG